MPVLLLSPWLLTYVRNHWSFASNLIKDGLRKKSCTVRSSWDPLLVPSVLPVPRVRFLTRFQFRVTTSHFVSLVSCNHITLVACNFLGQVKDSMNKVVFDFRERKRKPSSFYSVATDNTTLAKLGLLPVRYAVKRQRLDVLQPRPLLDVKASMEPTRAFSQAPIVGAGRRIRHS